MAYEDECLQAARHQNQNSKKQPERKAISVEKLEQRKNRELNSNRFRTDQSINQFIKSKRTNRPLTSQENTQHKIHKHT